MVSRFALAPVIAVALALALASGVAAQAYDPYGPRASSGGPAPRDERAVTRFLGVFDGTPRYELYPTTMARSDAGASGLLAFNTQDYLPVDAGKASPHTTGEHGGLPVDFHYLVKYWETYPNAKERQGHVPHLGVVATSVTDNTNSVRPPAAVRAVLDRQIDTLYRAIIAHPFVQRSEGMQVSAVSSYGRKADGAGTEIWGFQLDVYFTHFSLDRARLRPDGRYVGGLSEGPSVRICSNCVDYLHQPSGRYRGMQTMAATDRILVDTVAAPIWISRYRGGQGPLIVNPELFDAARPAGDIQILTLDTHGGVGIAAKVAPDTAIAKVIAATWLNDWRAVVNQLNGPGAPRAD